MIDSDILKLIEKQVKTFNIPWVTKDFHKHHNPFRVLVSCILSLRTKDKVTQEASLRLFKVAKNSFDLAKLKPKQIEKLIYPVGFYRKKAKNLHNLAIQLIKKYKGVVPNNETCLLEFKGVGRKTANLVLGLGYGIPSICVDTHVHRISNRLGWVETKTPQSTENNLKKIIPKNWWIKLNTLLVAFGQNICLPVRPLCSKCYVNKYCKKINVISNR
ncbi:MAG: endonuclease III [Candidatus Omnitrophica bacterium]|nr:endonuclease III [Candidatus Omnitrophota bacterium]MCM8827425.1 endonuclease III [Candidatus Omnitrophota bacterium]